MSGGPREIRNQQSLHHLRDVIQTLFGAELLAPSKHLWLVSPWISNIRVLDNRAGEFAVVAPEWPRSEIRLTQCLVYLADRGTEVHVAARDAELNQPVLERLRDAARYLPGRIHVHTAATLHEKGLLGDRFYLEGSLNFTKSGITTSEEKVVLHVDPALIAENRVAFRKRWNGGQP